MRALLIMIISLTLSCEKKNIFDDLASTESNEALYLDAKNHLDKFEFDQTVSIIQNRLSPAFRSQRRVQVTLMHAYGGKCGINFLQIVNRLTNTNQTKLFPLAMDLFSATDVDSAACENATDILSALGAVSTRTTNENLFGAILGFAQIGTTLRERLDADDDGVVDANVHICQSSGALADAHINRVSGGMGLIFENLAAIASEIDNSGMLGGLEDAQEFCETPTFPGIAANPQVYDNSLPTDWGTLQNPPFSLPIQNPPTLQDLGLPADVDQPLDCLNTSSTAVSAKMRRTLRRLIDSQDIGVGSCDLSNITTSFTTSPLKLTIHAHCCPLLEAP